MLTLLENKKFLTQQLRVMQGSRGRVLLKLKAYIDRLGECITYLTYTFDLDKLTIDNATE